ncbi:regulator of amino acid metabolism, contains ACT domain protein [Thermococcus chitonophagus]|uniref:Regulator of amino acid metabolism, contains ACT domain protein n=1 Tax=Thermococcus chitonophagus TaxID=54262 RepID=A0A160VRQ0_9EURY|nr:regulator of amino acid metabolism, contains ACT domain protein [Thermococcus chitonophagus]ASJ16033.1 regulator of amino acid metabolism, contains ACT domain protein [Thermococcus chitonophagus]CUX77279.1 hypothetical protein CHITON_0500 [Thermococcus chitonophagus]
MIHILEEYFKNYPARRKVVEFLWNAGLSVRDGKVYIKDVEVPITGIAQATGVNRKIVYHTIEYIESKPALKILFENLSPKSSLISIAPLMGWEVLELTIQKGSYERVLAKVLQILAEKRIRVVEIFGSNPYEDKSKAYLVIEGVLPFEVIASMRTEGALEKIVIHTPERNKERMICPKCEVKYCPRKVIFTPGS